MKINFIVPFTSCTGGIKIVFEYANRLSEKGHDVIIYMPIVAYNFDSVEKREPLKLLKSSLGNVIKRGKNVNWFDLKVKVKLVPLIKNSFIRDADVSIATAWPTAYDVDKLRDSKGKKVYLIQHYETWSGPKDKVDKSYKLPLKHIVIAKWLYDLMQEKFSKKDIELVYNGIDFNEFNNYKRNKIESDECITISMMYHTLEWKGVKDGIKAFEQAQQKVNKKLKLKLFGMEKDEDVPKYAEFYLKPDKKTLKDIYCESDIFIYPSRKEGWGLTPMEAMACECAVLGTNTGCIEEIGINNKNCIVVQPENIEELTYGLIRLIESKELRDAIAKEGYETALKFSWNVSVEAMEKALMGL